MECVLQNQVQVKSKVLNQTVWCPRSAHSPNPTRALLYRITIQMRFSDLPFPYPIPLSIIFFRGGLPEDVICGAIWAGHFGFDSGYTQ